MFFHQRVFVGIFVGFAVSVLAETCPSPQEVLSHRTLGGLDFFGNSYYQIDLPYFETDAGDKTLVGDGVLLFHKVLARVVDHETSRTQDREVIHVHACHYTYQPVGKTYQNAVVLYPKRGFYQVVDNSIKPSSRLWGYDTEHHYDNVRECRGFLGGKGVADESKCSFVLEKELPS